MGSDTPVVFGSAGALDPHALEARIDERLASWLDGRSASLTADARASIEAVPDRIRGQWLVVGARAGPADTDSTDLLPAAVSVELLYGQAIANATAIGLGPDAIDREDALLASDYLHALAYTAMGDLETTPSIREACFETLSAASQRLSTLWSRSAGDPDTGDATPIDPVVMATAGELAGVLGQSGPDARDALRRVGAGLGIARFQTQEGIALSRVSDSFGTLSIERGTVADLLADPNDALDGLLDPLPDSSATETLRSFAGSILADADDRHVETPE